MSRFLSRLVRPTVHSLLDALHGATAAANEEHLALDASADSWNEFLTEIRDQAQGLRVWGRGRRHDLPVVGLAWWTDAHDRRHFVVRGDSAGLSRMNWADFPPCWHVCPERFVRRERGGHSHWLALCDCGACGLPEAIGWSGDRCGDCYLGRTGLARSGIVATLRDDRPLDHLHFSPDDTLLATGGRGLVTLWEVGTRAMRGQLERVFPAIEALIFDHDGSRIGVAGGDRLLRWYDVETGAERESMPIPREIVYLGLSKDGKILAACGKSEQEVWWRREGRWVLEVAASDPCNAGALSADGRYLLVNGQFHLDLFDLGDYRPDHRPSRKWSQYLWNSQGSALSDNLDGSFSAYHWHAAAWGPMSYKLERVGVADGFRTWLGNARRITGPRFDPSGLWLGGFDIDTLVFTAASTPTTTTSLAPHAGTPTAFAFAHDNETLAFACLDGSIRLWPWRRLVVA